MKLSFAAIFVLLSFMLLIVLSQTTETSFAQATFGEPIQLTSNHASSSPRISGDGSRVAFISFVNGINEVFVVNSDGTGLKQLTSAPFSVVCLSISDDGSKVAFSVSMTAAVMENIFVVNTDGAGQPIQLTHDINWAYYQFPSISGDGSRVAYVSNNNGMRNDVFMVNSDGTGLTQITNVFITPGAIGPSVSTDRDGSTMTFTYQISQASRWVYVINSDSTGLTRLADARYQDHWEPSISGDGSKVAFCSDVNNIKEVFTAHSDGTQTKQITNNGPAGGDYPRISGDGSKVAFCSNANGYSQIFVANSDGTGTAQVTNNVASHWAPSISHDGSKVVYCSDVAGVSDIFLVSLEQAPNMPCLEVKVESPVNILIIDQNGHKVGYDSTTHSTVNEINGATYTGPGTEPQTITLPGTNEGTYIIQLYGTGTGEYTLTATNYAQDGTTKDKQTWQGTTNPTDLQGTTITIDNNGTIHTTPMFLVPEYALGSLLALGSCFAAFATFKKRQNPWKNPPPKAHPKNQQAIKATKQRATR